MKLPTPAIRHSVKWEKFTAYPYGGTITYQISGNTYPSSWPTFDETLISFVKSECSYGIRNCQSRKFCVNIKGPIHSL